MAGEAMNRTWIEKREGRVAQWAESLLGGPLAFRLRDGLIEAQTRAARGAQAVLALLGLPSHADYDKLAAVVSRTSRKLTTLEANLARIEGLMEEFGPLAVPAVAPPAAARATRRPAAPHRRPPAPKRAPASAPAPRVAAPLAAGPREGLLSPLATPKRRVSDMVVRAGKTIPTLPRAAEMLSGFAPKARRKAGR